jgi:Tat protein translocase TatB subunit
MFGIGMNEFLLLVLLALVLIGPKQLPEVARGLGKLLAAFRRATADLRNAVSEEINAHPEYRELSRLRDELSGDVRKMQDRARSYLEEEFREEQRIAGAFERDVRKVGEQVSEGIREGSQEDISGPPSAGASELHEDKQVEAPPHHVPYEQAYSKFYTASDPKQPGAPANGEGAVPQAAAPGDAERAADSPEDAYLRERESARAGAEPDATAGRFLLSRGGRARAPALPTDPAGAEAGESVAHEEDERPEPSRAAGGEKA